MTVDTDKIRTKVQFVREAVRRLEDIRSRGREAFLADPILQGAAERNLQVGIEAILDTANHIIAREGFAVPKTYREAMETLVREKILPAAQRENFVRMASFRNRAVHLYDQIDPGEVYDILKGHLGDFETFLRAITGRYLTSDEREVP
ncbi:MAG TPA: DUF86 domain-containing protein [Thermoanaerobaculia bacterium]|nr:DUF86 domain-containing protein [Thermoanaerobaculia bacterium]